MSIVNLDLRKKAEALLRQSETEFANMSTDVIQKLMYEFKVHQIELELQNDELKHSQHELTISRDAYAKLFNSSPIAYIELNEQGLIQNLNPATAHLLKTSQDELINKKLALFINPEDQDNYHFFIRNILTLHTDQILTAQLIIPNTNTNYLRPNGLKHCGCSPETCRYNHEFVYVECRGKYNCNDGNHICLSIVDVTETTLAYDTIACLYEKMEQKIFEQNRNLVENNKALIQKVEELSSYKQQLIEREEKLNSIFNAAFEGIITTDRSGNIISINNAVENIFGYAEEELIGQCISKIIPLSEHLNIMPSQWLAGVNGNVRELTGLHKEGSSLPLDVSIAQFTLSGTGYITSIVRDVTARKLQEQRDQLHLDELAHVTRIGLMGEMASGIAHEVNQPLTAIVSYSQACLNLIENKNYDLEELSDILLKTKQQALKAGQIIHRMRDFVKFNKVHRSTININCLIQDAAGLCESTLKQNQVLLHLQLETNIPTIGVDCVQIEQVILNLIRNSIEALTNIAPPNPRILSVQTTMSSENEMEIRIKDNGPGIDTSEQNKILTPFFTTKPDGMGMGLSICRSIIESHEGVLRFNSLPNKGTTFYFTLPVRAAANGK